MLYRGACGFLRGVGTQNGAVLFFSIVLFSRIFTDFIVFARRFERFQEANGCETRSFSGFCMRPSNFRMKIHEISALGAKRYRNMTKTVPDVKITLFL